MLHHLAIRDFAIVDAIDIALAPGMTVITGETGAGKSLLVDALHLLLGGRADLDLIRSGAVEASVTGVFSLGDGQQSQRVRAALEQVGVRSGNGDGSELLVRRSVPSNGRGRAYVNDVLVTVGTLASALDGVVDIMGQHEHQSLTSHDNQLALLDAFGKCGPLRETLAASHDRLRALLDERTGLARGESEQTARSEFLKFQLDELGEIDPQPGELARLEDERRRLGSVDKLRTSVAAAEALAYGDERSACTLLTDALRQLEPALALAPELSEPRRCLDEARTLASEAARDLGHALARLEADPERLALVEDRLAALRRLGRKHGVEPDQLADQARTLAAELDAIAHADSRLAELDAAIAIAQKELGRAASALSKARREAAKKLGRACKRELAELAMAEATVAVVIEPLAPRADPAALVVAVDGVEQRVGRSGGERVEFVLQANPGEVARPLIKVASGGELSRLALALRRVLADRDPVPTYVFDEVDAAVGGATAEAVGKALQSVARDHQVICVTHLPQVAALADHHLRVIKKSAGKRTAVVVEALGASERIEEIARMLAGAETTESARRHARTLLRRAQA